MKVQLYRTPQGHSPVEAYIESLDKYEAAPVYACLGNIAAFGLENTPVQRRPIEGKLWELKIGRHRIFYVLTTGPTMVLLHACKKQGRKARKRDLDIALSRMKEVLDAD